MAHAYSSGDYAGVSTKDGLNLYYGYERTFCPDHGKDNENACYEDGCDQSEWCFVATLEGKEFVRWSESEFAQGENPPMPSDFLLLGIAKFIEECSSFSFKTGD